MKRPGRMSHQVMHSVGKKAATVMYPAVKIEMPENFRGKITFEAEKCIGCKMCMRDCPSNAIEIVKVGEKRFECRIDCSKCIYCAQCVDSCPKDALHATREFELAGLEKGSMKVVYHAPAEKPKEPEKSSEPKP